ncbi:MAG: hypothetical protein K0R24_1501 [Gammaproteobacteria bacterium]|jgi:ankyrin repeat protein|nr:hypothetical protein [Gammaproteobacteria bacterium]
MQRNQSNPAHGLLSEVRQKSFLNQKIIKKENYVLINLSMEKAGEICTLSIQSRKLVLLEHHLSIYREFAVKKSKREILSPFHHTLLCDTLSIHVHFDCYGQYLKCIVNNKKDGKTLKVSESEEKKIERASQLCIRETMKKIIEELQEKHSIRKKEYTDVLSELKKLSASGINNQKYLDLLNKTIALLDKANDLTFCPDYASKNFLVAQKAFIEKELSSRKSAKKQAKTNRLPPPKQGPLELEEKEVEPPILENTVKPKTRAELEMLFEQPLQEAESSVDYVKEKKDIINELWALCSPRDLHFALAIIEKQNHLDKIREDYLKAACRANDIPTVSGLFNEDKDVYLATELVGIAIIHGHHNMLDFLYGKKRIRYLSEFITMPLDDLNNQIVNDILQSQYSSPLWFAYKKRDLALFSTILGAGKADPNERNGRGEPILYICIRENQLDFARKLLEAEANVNNPIIQFHVQMSYLKKVFYNAPLEANVGETPLHVAAMDRNQEAFALLRDEYKADITQRAANGSTVFGSAVYPFPDRPLCREIIEKMIGMGCNINEELGHHEATALHYACQFKNEEAVQLLLELGGDPLQKQMINTSGGKRAGNPLLIAFFKEADTIINIILTHLEKTKSRLNHKEILRVLSYPYLLDESSKNRLESLYRQAYYKNVILRAYKEKKYDEAIEACDIFFNQYPMMPADEGHFILYTISCCLLESAKNKEKAGNLQKAKELIDGGIGHMQTCLSIRQSPEIFAPFFCQGLVNQAQQKLSELKEKQAELDAQLAIPNYAQQTRVD